MGSLQSLEISTNFIYVHRSFLTMAITNECIDDVSMIKTNLKELSVIPLNFQEFVVNPHEITCKAVFNT